MIFSNRPEPPDFDISGPSHAGLIIKMIDDLGRRIDAAEKDIVAMKIRLEVTYIKVSAIILVLGSLTSTIVSILIQRVMA